MENFNLGIGKMSIIPKNLIFLSAVLPKTSVITYNIQLYVGLGQKSIPLPPLPTYELTRGVLKVS